MSFHTDETDRILSFLHLGSSLERKNANFAINSNTTDYEENIYSLAIMAVLTGSVSCDKNDVTPKSSMPLVSMSIIPDYSDGSVYSYSDDGSFFLKLKDEILPRSASRSERPTLLHVQTKQNLWIVSHGTLQVSQKIAIFVYPKI